MRLGLIIYRDLDTVSGGYLYDRQLVEYLKQQGEDVKMISLAWRNYSRHIIDNLTTSLYKALSDLQVDILLQDELNHPSLFWLNKRLRQVVNYPFVSIVHHLRCSEKHSALINNFYRMVEKHYLRTVDGMVLNSQTTRNSVASLGFNLDEIPHIVAYPAGDHIGSDIQETEINNRSFEPGPLRLLFIGNLIPRKGLHTLLSAMERLPSEACRLTIVGSHRMNRKYAEEIRRKIYLSELEGLVEFANTLRDDQLAEQIRSHHVIVVPSSYEGYGIVYLEGMSFGLPAIATNSGGAKEIISNGVNGYLIQPWDYEALADRLNELAGDRQHLLQLSLAARDRFLSQPSWEDTSKSIHQFLIDFPMRE